jgi:hypothetical protein
VLERNALQTRSASTAMRLESELRQRLQQFNGPQLKLLARGSSDERSAMAWLAVFKRIQIAADQTRQVLFGKLSSQEPKKLLPLQLRIGLYAKPDGALLCAHRTVLLDSAASEARQREQQVILELSNAAGDYNNQTLELKLQRPFGSDFDDF